MGKRTLTIIGLNGLKLLLTVAVNKSVRDSPTLIRVSICIFSCLLFPGFYEVRPLSAVAKEKMKNCARSKMSLISPPCEFRIDRTLQHDSLKIRVRKVIFSPTSQLQAQFDSMQVIIFADVINLKGQTVQYTTGQFLLACDGGRIYKQWLKAEKFSIGPHKHIRIAMAFNPPTSQFYSHPKLISVDGNYAVDLIRPNNNTQ